MSSGIRKSRQAKVQESLSGNMHLVKSTKSKDNEHINQRVVGASSTHLK